MSGWVGGWAFVFRLTRTGWMDGYGSRLPTPPPHTHTNTHQNTKTKQKKTDARQAVNLAEATVYTRAVLSAGAGALLVLFNADRTKRRTPQRHGACVFVCIYICVGGVGGWWYSSTPTAPSGSVRACVCTCGGGVFCVFWGGGLAYTPRVSFPHTHLPQHTTPTWHPTAAGVGAGGGGLNAPLLAGAGAADEDEEEEEEKAEAAHAAGPPRHPPLPEPEAGLFSLWSFSWLNPVLSVGYQRPLTHEDLYALHPEETADKICGK